jgi:hypothetical protein
MSVKVFHKVAVPTHGMVREFSEELHGKDYKEIAKSYVANYPHNIASVEGLDIKPAKLDATGKELSARDLLKAKAESLGIPFAANISTANLTALVEAKEAEEAK